MCALQDMCIVLELGDATLLVPSLKKVAAVTAGIPSLQAFVTQVLDRAVEPCSLQQHYAQACINLCMQFILKVPAVLLPSLN